MIVAGQVGFPQAIMGCIVSGVFVAVGIVIMLVPAELMLKWDRRSGYWVYQTELKASGDEILALAKAATFYKVFGDCFVVMGLSSLFVWTWSAFGN